MAVNIRPAYADDAGTIAAFNAQLALETETKTLDRTQLGLGVADLLANPDRGRYFLAEVDGEIVGQLMITYEWSDWRNGLFWWIQSVFVRPETRRRGVFTALYNHIQSLASDEDGVCGIRLYVERDNQRAQRTYETLGMIKTGYQVMEVDFIHAGHTHA